MSPGVDKGLATNRAESEPESESESETESETESASDLWLSPVSLGQRLPRHPSRILHVCGGVSPCGVAALGVVEKVEA